MMLLCVMTILTPNSSHILQTNDHANMEARYRKAGVVANDGETNSGVTLESAPPGASPGGWCGVGGGYSYPPPAATPLASASASHCHGFIDLFTPTADWRWLLLRKTPPTPTTSSSPLLAPLFSVQATQGTGVMEDTIKTALTELLQRRVPEATEK